MGLTPPTLKKIAIKRREKIDSWYYLTVWSKHFYSVTSGGEIWSPLIAINVCANQKQTPSDRVQRPHKIETAELVCGLIYLLWQS